jgi:Trypsin-co-occurring domain 1
MGGAVSELLAFRGADGHDIVVEISEEDPGFHLISARDDKIAVAPRRLTEMLGAVRKTIQTVVAEVADMDLPAARVGEITVEFGVKCSAEAGAYIAKASGEGHITVTIKCAPKIDDN